MKDEELELISKKIALKQKIAFALTFVGAFMSATFVGAFVFEFAREYAGVVVIMVAGAGAVVVAAIGIFILSRFLKLLIRIADSVNNRKTKESKIATPFRYKLLRLSEIFFSAKTQKEVFLPVMADWDEEVYKALEKDKDASLFMINARNTYAFLTAMLQKSPIGDLIEFVRKFAK
jgi:hypothetical protein